MKNNFRVILAKEKKTIREVYQATGVSRTTLLKLWREESTPELPTLLKVADFLSCTLDDLIKQETHTTHQERGI